MRKHIRYLKAQLKAAGIDITCIQHRGSGHLALQITNAAGRTARLIVAASPSCRRAMLNCVSLAKRMLAQPEKVLA